MIFHDSMCDDINESIMIRENVRTTKIPTLDLVETKRKLEEVGHTDVIVIQVIYSYVWLGAP